MNHQVFLAENLERYNLTESEVLDGIYSSINYICWRIDFGANNGVKNKGIGNGRC